MEKSEEKEEIKNEKKEEIKNEEKENVELKNEKKENVELKNEEKENEEIEFIKYEKMLDIKKLENEIYKNEYIIDLLNYNYKNVYQSLKINYIIDVCFSLQNLLYYINTLSINEEIPLLYICQNLQLFKFQKEKLISLFEYNINIKLSQLFSLYEYFESLIFPEFIYQINNGYMTKIPIYLSKKILYIFEKDELKSNIIFTKIELIEAIRKCLSRYIASSTIKEDFITEELNKELFDLLLKEDLWNKNVEMNKLKNSFNYINNYLKYTIKVKHIFNLLEILIGINDKNYLTFDNFKEEEKKEKEKEDYLLKFTEEKKNEEKEEKETKKITAVLAKIAFEAVNRNSLPLEIIKELKLIKRRKKYINNFIKKSKLMNNYIDNIDTKENNKENDITFKNLLNDVMNYGSILNKEKVIKKLYDFISNPEINIKLTKLKEKKNILNIGNNITDIIVFNKNKIIISYRSERIKLYSFDKKTFREETILKPLEILNIREIKNLDEVNCMKELINGTLLLGTRNGFIMNLEINETKKKKFEYNIKLLNLIELENHGKINELIEINTNTFISSDDDKNNIVWENNKNKMILKKGKLYKVNNILIIINDNIAFFDIKKNYREIEKIDKKLCNCAIFNEKYLLGEDSSSWKVHLININEKKYLFQMEYTPKKSLIVKNICDKYVFNLEKDSRYKLIMMDVVDDKIISNNEESITIESNSYLTNLFDEFFIVIKDGNIICYGYF